MYGIKILPQEISKKKNKEGSKKQQRNKNK